MTTVNLTIPATLADGQPAIADDTSLAFRELEGLFQSDVHDENFAKGGVLRSQSFRKSGLTEVFTRKTTSEHWSLFPGAGALSYDVPGGALRFRLRYPAEVLVFFTASIFRLNKRDSTKLNELADGDYLDSSSATNAHFTWTFNALWEGGDSEPGSHYIQAQSVLRANHLHVDKNNISRGVFLPWKIRPVDITTAPSGSTYSTPVPLEDTRMISPAATPNLSEVGRLQAGWHNIRHTAQWDDPSETTHLLSSHTMVIGNTELVVVANYGRRADDFFVASEAKSGNK
jgi:hypothetical protein